MKTSTFHYLLPEDQIAQEPLPERSKSRLLVADISTGNLHLEDGEFSNLPFYALKKLSQEGDGQPLFLVNDSRVFPARIRIRRKTGARGEVFLLEQGERLVYRCLIRPAKKLRVGEALFHDTDTSCLQELLRVESLDPPLVSLHNDKIDNLIESFGEMPLPPYINRDPQRVSKRLTEIDRERYQTVYAGNSGSVAAPTAGLHFTPEIISLCKDNQIGFMPVTLHVGLGTFLPVTASDIAQHLMHEELFCVGNATIVELCKCLQREQAIVFVGTTSFRTVESLMRLAFPVSEGFDERSRRVAVLGAARSGRLEEILLPFVDRWHATSLFIYPQETSDSFLPACGHALLTNFHQPESTLVMLVAALMGIDSWRQMYTHAVQSRYRFLSYGDSSLIIFSKVK